MKIIWNEPKRLSNLAKHGLDFAEIGAEFFAAAAATPAVGQRLKFVGIIRGTAVVVVIALPLRREAVSIISLRRANRKERRVYGGKTQGI